MRSFVKSVAGAFVVGTAGVIALDIADTARRDINEKRRFHPSTRTWKEALEVGSLIGAFTAVGGGYGHWRASRS